MSKPPAKFTDYEFDDRLMQAINGMGWEFPTTVQSAMIPQLLRGANVVARARTGTGKTAAFLLPLIHSLLQHTDEDEKTEGPFAVILAPTKELVTQIYECLTQLIARFPFLQTLNLCEREQASEELALETAIDVLLGTPGRILEVTKRKKKLLKHVKFLVLDEADLLFSFGYKDDLKKLKKRLPSTLQIAMTSATLEEDMQELKTMFVSGKVISLKLKESQLPNPDQLSQYHVYIENDEQRFTIIISLLKLKLLRGKTIFFVNSVERGYKLYLFLQGFKIRSCVLNSHMPANSRSHIINEFNAGRYQYIIASDARDISGDREDEKKDVEAAANNQAASPADENAAATATQTEVPQKKKKNGKKAKPRLAYDRESGVARGIDFHYVSNVINFDFPTTTDVYIHRVGRTARGYNNGTALSLIAPHERNDFELVHDDIASQMGADAIAPYEFRLADFDSFLLRTREVLSAITKSVLRETRLAEIKRELLASKRLESYFAKNPREKAALENDKRLYGLHLHSTGIADVADYMVPKQLRGRNYKSDEMPRGGRRNNFDANRRRPKRHGRAEHGSMRKYARKDNDPLRTFTI